MENIKHYITEQDLTFLKARAKDRVLCICGKTFRKDNITNHYKSKYHIEQSNKNINGYCK